MSEDLPQLAAGYVRLAVLLEGGRAVTHGDVVRASGVGLDHLGPVLVLDNQAWVDVVQDQAESVRQGLESLGPTQVMAAEPIRYQYRWLRLGAGRNHGLTMGQLRKLLNRADAGPLGRIHINNTPTLVGLREDHIEGVERHFAEARVNGVTVRPTRPPPGEIREPPDYKPKR